MKELAIYVSAAPEMDAECELLGQLLAEMTPATRWVIKRTPAPNEGGNPDLDALRASHLYLILLGMDIYAPMGVEWMAAQGAHITTFAFRSTEAVPSPAATDFARNAPVAWVLYETPLDFVRQFEHLLIEELLRGTPGYGLDLADVEGLLARQERLEEAPDAPDGEDRRGAGRGGVILPKAE
jgi:hypothetical protein